MWKKGYCFFRQESKVQTLWHNNKAICSVNDGMVALLPRPFLLSAILCFGCGKMRLVSSCKSLVKSKSRWESSMQTIQASERNKLKVSTMLQKVDRKISSLQSLIPERTAIQSPTLPIFSFVVHRRFSHVHPIKEFGNFAVCCCPEFPSAWY